MAGPVEAAMGFRPTECSATPLKLLDTRAVVRYEVASDGRRAALVGKWYAGDRGEVVATALRDLRSRGFTGSEVAVPAVVAYLPGVRALVVEAVDGPMLWERLRADDGAAGAARAGSWLARFHASGLRSPRSCGPDKMRRAVRRWLAATPAGSDLAGHAAPLTRALARLERRALPVHFDYYQSQVIVEPQGPTVVVDLDEAGMGDPAFDVAHFEAHLELLAVQWFDDPTALLPASDAFRAGYRSVAALPEPHPALSAFAWFKLAVGLARLGGPRAHRDHAVRAVRRSLASA